MAASLIVLAVVGAGFALMFRSVTGAGSHRGRREQRHSSVLPAMLATFQVAELVLAPVLDSSGEEALRDALVPPLAVLTAVLLVALIIRGRSRVIEAALAFGGIAAFTLQVHFRHGPEPAVAVVVGAILFAGVVGGARRLLPLP